MIEERRQVLLKVRRHTLIALTCILVPAVVIGWFWFIGGVTLW